MVNGFFGTPSTRIIAKRFPTLFPFLNIPIPLPEEGTEWIDQPLVAHELTTLRTCMNRQQPFGTPEWQQQLATALGLESTLRPRGRPAKLK